MDSGNNVASEPRGAVDGVSAASIGVELNTEPSEDPNQRRESALNAQTRRRNPARRARQEPGEESAQDKTQGRLAIRKAEPMEIVALSKDPQACPKCLQEGLQLLCMGSWELGRHIAREHPAVDVTWLCGPCQRRCATLRSWSCHVPHCKGRQEPEELPFKCENCSLSFGTKTGLSQHERHVHPEVRNDKRAAEANKPKGKGGRRPSIWTDDDLLAIWEIERKNIGARDLNERIAEHFPGKTARQVSDARRRKDYAVLRERGGPQGPAEQIEAIEEVDEGEIPYRMEPVAAEGTVMESGSPENGESAPAERVVAPAPESDSQHNRESNPAAGSEEQQLEDSSDDEEFSDALGEISIPELLSVERTTISPSPEDNWERTIKWEICNTCENAGSYAHWVTGLQELARNNALSTRMLDSLYDQLIQIMQSRSNENNQDRLQSNARGPQKRGHRRNRRRRRLTTADRKRFAFARCQDLWDNNPKKLAELVVANDLSLLQRRAAPNKTDTQALYKELWGKVGPTIEAPMRTEDPIPTSRIFTPITPREVRDRIRRIKNDSAAGPDGVTKEDLRGEGLSIALSKLFNSLLLAGYYPKAWRENRTTLLPKADKDTADVKNWRPITISSMVSRVYSGLLDQRIRAVIKQCDRQKGFTEENGCFSNIKLLNDAISNAKKAGGIITILDIAKAFDTVPHSVIQGCLEKKGIPATVAAYISGMYRDCFTAIRTRDGDIRIEMKRGVKQGDPLSPLIFNLVLEPLLERLQETGGVEIEGMKLSCAAFADDIACFAINAPEAERQLQMVADYLGRLDMSLSVNKCSSIEYVPNRKTWYTKNPSLKVNGNAVPSLSPSETFRYLGAKVSPWRGMLGGFEIDTFKEVILRVQRLPLKPMQKVDLLQSYIFPRYTYGLIVSPPAKAVLKSIDRIIRSNVKEILHLPESVSTSFLYTPRKQGGLGLLEVEKMVLIAALRNGLKARQSTDPVTRAAMNTNETDSQLKSYADALRLHWPITTKELDTFKYKLRLSYAQKWAEQKWQGQGVEEFAQDTVGNSWLRRYDLLPPSRYIDAIKLRTNTYPTRAMMKIIDGRVDSSCRKCLDSSETLGHILGRCRYTKDKRISRHNEIKDLLKARLATRYQVMDEPQITVQGRRFKPDLVVKTNEERVLVIDVTVRYEHRTYLDEGRTEKINKYRQILSTLRRDLQSKSEEVVPIVVGSRGAIPKETRKALLRLGIGRNDWLTISLIALRSSLEIVNAFMDD